MATTQQASSKAKASPAAPKAATAPRQRGKKGAPAAMSTDVVVGPKGAPLVAQGDDHQIPEEQRQGERRQQTANNIAQFTPQEHTATAAHNVDELSEEERKRVAFEEQVKLLATQFNIDPATVPVLQPVQPAQAQGNRGGGRQAKEVRNNVPRPGEGTQSRKIWDLADKLSAANNGQPIPVGTLREQPEMKQFNDFTIRTQFARWRSYHGIKGRAAAPAAPEQEQHNRRADDPKTEEPQADAE